MSQDHPEDPTQPLDDAAETPAPKAEKAAAPKAEKTAGPKAGRAAGPEAGKAAEPKVGREAHSPVYNHATERRPEESSTARILRLVDSGVGLLEQALLAIFLVVLVSIGVAQAVTLKFGSGLGVWSYELLRYAVFFIAMTGAALSAHTGQLIAMDFVTRLLGATMRARLQVVLQAFTLAICLFMVKGGLVLAASVQPNSAAAVDPHLGIMALPVGAGLMGLHVLLHMVIDLTYLVRGELPPENNLEPSGH